MKSLKKSLSLFLAFLMIAMCVSTLAITVSAAPATSGTCGKNVKWSFDKKTGTLTISGNGPTYNYNTYKVDKNGFYVEDKNGFPVLDKPSPIFKNYGGEENFDGPLKKVVVKSGVTSIGNELFAYCTSLKSVVLPDTVTTIGNSAFFTTSLEKITVPKKLKKIGSSALSHTFIKSFTMPDTVTEIGESAFYECTLEKVVLSKNLKSIPDYAFLFTPLTSIVIPKSVTYIGCDVFSSGIKTLVVPANVKKIGNLFEMGDWSGKNIYFYNPNLKFELSDLYEGMSFEESVFPDNATLYVKKGSATESFLEIINRKSEFGKATIKALPSGNLAFLSYTSKSCSGKELKPTVTVLDKNGYKISSSNYTVKYSNNVKPGTANVTVTLKGSYIGTIKKTFKITLSKPSSLKSSDVKNTSLKLTWAKVNGAKYYKVEKSLDGKKWSEVKTLTGTSVSVTGLKAGTKYSFRVTALDSTKKVSSKASSVLKVTTKK